MASKRLAGSCYAACTAPVQCPAQGAPLGDKTLEQVGGNGARAPDIPQYRTLPCDSDDLTDRRIGSAEAFGKHAVKCRPAGRENRGSCSGNERRKAAEAEPRRPEKTESLDFSL